jgi:aldose 1-epimerase
LQLVVDPPLLLTAGTASVVVDTLAGGRVGQLDVGDQPLLIEPDPDRRPSIKWGSFPMAPWAGRIRNGRFRFDGIEHRLDPNDADEIGADETGADRVNRHAIHGTVFGRAWQVEERSPSTVTMTCPLTGALSWPFAGIARQRIELSHGALRCELSIESSGRPFPAVLGWHPWLLEPTDLRFSPTTMYRRGGDGLPTGELVEPAPRPWDDCFVNSRPVVLSYDRPLAPVVTIESDCDHWVLFDGVAGALCVEPQSGPPDGLGPDLTPHVLTPHVVRPGQPLSRAMTISWKGQTGR